MDGRLRCGFDAQYAIGDGAGIDLIETRHDEVGGGCAEQSFVT
jgi:hypothetical protein